MTFLFFKIHHMYPLHILFLPLYNMYVYVNLFEIKNLACACVNLLSLHFLYVEFEVIWWSCVLFRVSDKILWNGKKTQKTQFQPHCDWDQGLPVVLINVHWFVSLSKRLAQSGENFPKSILTMIYGWENASGSTFIKGKKSKNLPC